MALPAVHVGHRTAGRLRLKIPAMRGRRDYFERVAALLAAAPGVVAVEPQPHAASVVIHHRGPGDELLPLLERHGLAAVAAAAPGRPAARAAASAPTLTLEQALIPLLAVLAAVQAYRGRVLAPASTLLWYLFSLIRQ